ncbi:motility protein A [Sneathiella chinensis]|uniref:Flagellar motor protein MotA n=1 Tax=Sneathiella chinensis TaxID=349750 RepID=A0ABQ5U3D0_9PROT|nr:MotA/TolQ/ExbB proton channel family protein [Sneathiella chinensis]GLQ05847.1 flagellar motor protein MotA [Sneathiella chinensis]
MNIDFATVFGLFGSFAVVTAAVLVGGSMTAFYNLPAVLIVLGGTFLVTTMSFSWREMLHAQKLVLGTLVKPEEQAKSAAFDMLELAERCRGKGILQLQEHLGRIEAHSFQHKALQLVVDGLPAEEVNRILHNDLGGMITRHNSSAGILHRAAEVAPAMGLIGTLVGLIQMLSNLSDPSAIGPAMAVALLTTFYGAVLANMFFSPLASKLERNSTREVLMNRVFIAGATSIGRQENPRRLEMILNTLLPPAERVQFYK